MNRAGDFSLFCIEKFVNEDIPACIQIRERAFPTTIVFFTTGNPLPNTGKRLIDLSLYTVVVTAKRDTTSCRGFVLGFDVPIFRSQQLDFNKKKGNSTIILNTGEADHKTLHRLFKKLYELSCHSRENRSLAKLYVELIVGYLNHIYTLQYNAVQMSEKRDAVISGRFMTLLEESCTLNHRVTYYASLLCISRRYLTRQVTSVLGQSPKKLIDLALIKKAKFILEYTDSAIYEVADDLGFECASAFSSFFKKHTQCCPMEYRQIHSKK